MTWIKRPALVRRLIKWDIRLFTHTAILTLILIIGSPATATVYDDKFDLKNVASIAVELLDSANGACWTNLKEAREYAEEKLRMRGAKIDNDGVATANNYRFQIRVKGNRIYENVAGPCYGGVSLKLFTFGYFNGTWHVISAGTHDEALLHPENLNKSVIRAIKEFIAEFK